MSNWKNGFNGRCLQLSYPDLHPKTTDFHALIYDP